MRTSAKRLLIELCCEEGSNLSRVAGECGWETFRVTKEVDLRDALTREKVKRMLRKADRPVIHISLPCTAYCRWSVLNMSKGGGTLEKILKARQETLQMISEVDEMLMEFQEGEVGVSFKWPAEEV